MSYHKYRAKKVIYDNFSFASQGEGALYNWLKNDPDVLYLKCQETIYLTKARIIYKPDFTWTSKITGEVIRSEFKGFETPEWRIKRRLYEWYGPGPLQVWKGSAKNFFIHETINPVNND